MGYMKDLHVWASLGTDKRRGNCTTLHVPYKACPLSLVFWDKIGADNHIRPPCGSKSWTATQGKSGLVQVPTCYNAYVATGLCLLLRNKHKGRQDFHPWGDNGPCHRDTYPAQHLGHRTGDETPVFLRGDEESSQKRQHPLSLHLKYNRKSCWSTTFLKWGCI